VDIGSTTTDIIPIVGGKVALQGISDAERMREDTLVYTGVVRTPVMALAGNLAFEGGDVNVAAEYFATTADVYRLLGELDARYDMADTADGKGKTLPESARRLARMVGHDSEDRSLQTWRDLAMTCKQVQMQRIKTAMLKHLQADMTILAAGAGAFLAQAVAHKIGHACEPISMGLPAHADYGPCLPAYAVAQLAAHHA
jgi:probable H4MPT-linked C1 transfer pathway protein